MGHSECSCTSHAVSCQPTTCEHCHCLEPAAAFPQAAAIMPRAAEPAKPGMAEDRAIEDEPLRKPTRTHGRVASQALPHGPSQVQVQTNTKLATQNMQWCCWHDICSV